MTSIVLGASMFVSGCFFTANAMNGFAASTDTSMKAQTTSTAIVSSSSSDYTTSAQKIVTAASKTSNKASKQSSSIVVSKADQTTVNPAVSIKASAVSIDPGNFSTLTLTVNYEGKVQLKCSDNNKAYIVYVRDNDNKDYNQDFIAKTDKTYTIRIYVLQSGYFTISAEYSTTLPNGTQKNLRASSSLLSSELIKYGNHPYDDNKAYNNLTSTEKKALLSLKKQINKVYPALPNQLRKWLEKNGLQIRLVYGAYMQKNPQDIKAIGLSGTKITICTGAANSVQGTLYHEIGHYIQSCMSKYNKAFNQYISNLYDPGNTNYREYARSNEKEFWADTVSLYFTNPTKLQKINSTGYAFVDLVVSNPEAFCFYNLNDCNINILQPYTGYTLNEFNKRIYQLNVIDGQKTVYAKVGQKIGFNSNQTTIKPSYEVYSDDILIYQGQNNYTFEQPGTYIINVKTPHGISNVQNSVIRIIVTE